MEPSDAKPDYVLFGVHKMLWEKIQKDPGSLLARNIWEIVEKTNAELFLRDISGPCSLRWLEVHLRSPNLELLGNIMGAVASLKEITYYAITSGDVPNKRLLVAPSVIPASPTLASVLA